VTWRPGSTAARRLGAEIRNRRKARRLTQADLAHPMTKGFVSAVELGRVVPSLPALAHMAQRLDVSLAELFEGVKDHWTPVYTPADDPREAAPHRRR
jgi:transcriptional regulator with XRE-family HTH domain